MALMGVGRSVINSISFNGKPYHLILSIADDAARVYSPQVVEGDWQVTTPNVIASYMVGMTTQTKAKTPAAVILEATTYMNNKLSIYFGVVAPPVPATWEEQFEQLLKKLVLFVGTGGFPQVK
jgi:hypothetical protein